MLFPPSQLDALLRGTETGRDGYRFGRITTEVDPLTLVRAGSAFFPTAQYFASPGGQAIAGLGTAWRSSASGQDRFAALAGVLPAPVPPIDPFRMFLGFSFGPDGPKTGVWKGFSAADLVLPEIVLEAGGGRGELGVVCPPGTDPAVVVEALSMMRDPGPSPSPDPGDHFVESVPSVSEWKSEVGDAVAAIKSGALRKVVLARSVVVRSQEPTDGFGLVGHLESAYPQCYAFGWRNADATFVGASPELLLEKVGSSIRLNPLAGSARRGEGEDEDRSLGEALMASDKDREEHAFVVDDVMARLRPLTLRLDVPVVPSLRRMASVQHLSTEVGGTLQTGVGGLEVLGSLHPTPAVGGTPRVEAAAFIDKLEGIDRGWYTGGVGWLSPGGDCTIALSLRCGLLHGNTAHLYAGAGIVADSEPDAELAETRLKFRPLLEVLAAT